MADRTTAAGRRSRTGHLLRAVEEHLAAAASELRGPQTDPHRALALVTAAREALEVVRVAQVRDEEAPPSAGPALVRRTELPPSARAPRAARAFTSETCEQWSLPASASAAATDIASELVSNAAAHGTAPVLLALELGAGSVLVRVWDDGPGLPRLLAYRPGFSERGLGLRLVRQLSTHWGVAEDRGGKWVWARVALSGDAAAATT